MATLTVWKFPTPHGANEAEYTLDQLQKQGFIQVHDAAIVTWEFGSKQPSTRQLKSRAGGALGGSFWGLLFGVLFFAPVLAAAAGAVIGARRRKLSGVGVDDEFIKTVREKVTPGTSALFVMTSDANMDRVGEAFTKQDMELISTSLSAEQEKLLRETFGE